MDEINKKMNNKTRYYYIGLLSIAILTIVISCGSVRDHRVEVINHDVTIASGNYGSSEYDSAYVSNVFFDIIKGDRIEYRKFRNNCMDAESSGRLSWEMQKDWLIYGFIMAKVYQDTLAALDFAQNIEFMDISTDSALGIIIVDCLEMASKSKPDVISCSATYKLIEIYKEGLYGICPDKEKANYYRRLLESISSAIRQRKQAKKTEAPTN